MNSIIDGKEHHYDSGIHEYDDATKAYLQRRFTAKKEIWPKMYIQDPLPSSLPSLDTQKLLFLRTRPDLDTLKDQYERNNISTQYIMNCNLEESYKPFLDTVLSKVTLNGDTVPMKYSKKNEALHQKSIDLYRRFNYGDDLSPIELVIERIY